MTDLLLVAERQRDTLRAKITEMERQEPVGYMPLTTKAALEAGGTGDQSMTLSDEQIQDLLHVGNPTDEERRLIRIGWDAAIAEIRAHPIGWVDAGDLSVLKYGNSIWLNPDDEGQMVPVYLAANRGEA